jgi:predicted nucleic acid-binding Zn ribbon protein
MSIKMFTVRCEEHGKMEITKRSSECPKWCFVPIETGICNKPLKRIWDVPNIHFKGSGFYQTDKEK